MTTSKNVQPTTTITAGSPNPHKTAKKTAKPPAVAIPMISGKGRAQKTTAKPTKAARAADAASLTRRDTSAGKRPPTEMDVVLLSKRHGPKVVGKMSCLDAASKVLADVGKPMTSQKIVEAMLAKGLWKTSGKTPHATLYAAIIREIAKKGSNGRFGKTDRGHFTVVSNKKGA